MSMNLWVPQALYGSDLHPAGNCQSHADAYLEDSNDYEKPLEPGMDAKDTDEENRY